MSGATTDPRRPCKGQQLFGAWAIESDRFGKMAETVRRMSMAEIVALGAGTSAPTSRIMEVRNGVAVIDISGPITKHVSSFQSLFGGTATVLVRKAIREAVGNPDVNSILLVIDSPGGTVDGVVDLVDDVKAATERKPVWAYIEDLGASAAYWIASATARIVANRGAEVGSIGVFAVLEDSSAAAEQLGFTVHVVRTGPHKGTIIDGAPIAPETIADVQRLVDATFAEFSADVKTGRKLSADAFGQVSTGQVWIAKEAKGLGLVDAVQTLDRTFSQIAKAKPRSAAAATPKGSTMPHETTDPIGTAAATAKELRSKFPQASDSFIVKCLEDECTLAEASDRYLQHLTAENSRLAGALDKATAAATAAASPKATGTTPVPGNDGPPLELDAKSEIDRQVSDLMRRGFSRHDATRRVLRENPKLREAWVDDHNVSHSEQRRPALAGR